MTKKGMLLMAMSGAIMASGANLSMRNRSEEKPHWKETQTDDEREEKLRKAEEKRQRKLIKKYGGQGEEEGRTA